MKNRRVTYRSGKIAWQLDLGLVTQPDGKRKRVQTFYETKDAAIGAKNKAAAKRQRHGDDALTLTAAECVRFVAARDQLAAAGLTIEDAVATALAAQPVRRESVTLAHLLPLAEAHKKKFRAKVRYLQQFKCSCLSFIRGREHVAAHTVTREDVRGWVLGNAWMPKTQRVYLGDVRSLFAFGLEEGYVSSNPAAGVKGDRIHLAPLAESPIATLNSAQVKTVLTLAARVPENGEEDFRPLLAYVVLGFFCGIRPAELSRMQVSMCEAHAIVEGVQAKTRRRRVVDISANAIQWLALDCPPPNGPLTPPNFRRRWSRLRAAAGWKPELQALAKDDPRPDPSLPEWPHDVIRHTSRQCTTRHTRTKVYSKRK